MDAEEHILELVIFGMLYLAVKEDLLIFFNMMMIRMTLYRPTDRPTYQLLRRDADPYQHGWSPRLV